MVRTPPKSETTASISGIGPRHLVGAESLAPLHRPAEEGDLGVEARALYRGGADQRPGPAQRLPSSPSGHSSRVARRCTPSSPYSVESSASANLDRRGVGIAEHRRDLLLAVLAAAGRQGGGERQQAAVGENDAYRPPQDLPELAHRPAAYWREKHRADPALRPALRAAAGARLPLSHAREHQAPAPDQHDEVLTEEDVFEALEEVIDPELGLDFVSLGLVYDVEIEKEDVYVTFTLTTPACPIGPQVSEQMKEFVGDLPGVTAVHPKMIFDPAWSPGMMTDDAKFALGF